MKKVYFLILIFSVIASCKSQSTTTSIFNSLINKIDNQSVILNVNYTTTFLLDDNATRVLESSESTKLSRLLKLLDNKEKVLVSHVLLTKLLEPNKGELVYNYKYDNSGNVIETIYKFNGIEWLLVDGKNVILNFEKGKIYSYWQNKIK